MHLKKKCFLEFQFFSRTASILCCKLTNCVVEGYPKNLHFGIMYSFQICTVLVIIRYDSDIRRLLKVYLKWYKLLLILLLCILLINIIYYYVLLGRIIISNFSHHFYVLVPRSKACYYNKYKKLILKLAVMD